MNAGRVLSMASNVGDVTGPKDRSHGQTWEKFEKGLVGSTRPEPPGRPHLQIVRKDASPLAREISRRRMLGLAFIPSR